jgi:hypothetical protein
MPGVGAGCAIANRLSAVPKRRRTLPLPQGEGECPSPHPAYPDAYGAVPYLIGRLRQGAACP